jgi:hypothetical protein
MYEGPTTPAVSPAAGGTDSRDNQQSDLKDDLAKVIRVAQSRVKPAGNESSRMGRFRELFLLIGDGFEHQAGQHEAGAAKNPRSDGAGRPAGQPGGHGDKRHQPPAGNP